MSERLKPRLPSIRRGHRLARGLVVAWTFSEGTGPTVFDATRINHGTVTGTNFTRPAGISGPAIDFAGGTGKVSCAAIGLPLLPTDHYTIAFRHHTRSIVGYSGVFGFGPTNYADQTGQSRYIINNSNHYYFLGGGADWDTGIAWDADSQWHSIVFTAQGYALCRLYRDGVLVAGPLQANYYGVTAESYVTAGYCPAGGAVGQFSLDYGMIWSRALSPREVIMLHADPFAVLSTTPAAIDLIGAGAVTAPFKPWYPRRRGGILGSGTS